MAYLLDTNVFVEAKNRYYSFDFCPAFWSWIEVNQAAGSIRSVDQVRNELLGRDDELSAWIAERSDGFFLKPDAGGLPSLQRVSSWAAGGTYPPEAVSEFLEAADYYLVAQALAGGHVVVTQETPGATKRIKIPDACIAVGVPYINTFQMLRQAGARFVLAS